MSNNTTISLTQFELQHLVQDAVTKGVELFISKQQTEIVSLSHFSSLVGVKTDTAKRAFESEWNLGFRYGSVNEKGRWEINKYEAQINWNKR